MNNKYKVIIKNPLIRKGITIETECNEKYLAEVVRTLLDKVREINSNDNNKIEIPSKENNYEYK